MVKEGESHAQEDQAKKKEIEVRNNADALLYSTEKTLREYSDKVNAADKAAIETTAGELRTALEGTDTAAIESAMEKLQMASHKLAEAMYQTSSAQDAGPSPEPEAGHAAESGEGSSDGESVDADFTVVDDDEKK
jgi:molecular chaperone DnaK